MRQPRLSQPREHRGRTLVAGDAHALGAAIEDGTLTVFVDGTAASHCAFDADTAALVGPAGVRSDNVRADFDLRVAPGRSSQPFGDED